MLTSLFLALFLGTFAFEKFGLSGEIGALFIGILMSNYKFADNLAEKAAINMANVLQSAAAAIGNEDGNNGGGGNTANNMAEKAHIGAMENINRAQQTMKNLGPLASFKDSSLINSSSSSEFIKLKL